MSPAAGASSGAPAAASAAAPLRCTAEDDPCYARRTVAVVGARVQQTEQSAADTHAYLSARAKQVLHAAVGGTGGRRAANLGDDVLLFIGPGDRGCARGQHPDDATSPESLVVPAQVRAAHVCVRASPAF